MRRALVLFALMPALASASPLEQFGVGFAGTARGVAYFAGADDLFATFHNPAGLMAVEVVEFTFLHQINAPFLRLELDNPSPAYEPASPAVFQNTTLGFAVPLTGRLKGRAVLGAVLEVPDGVLVRARALDSRRPYWFFYDSYPDVFVAQIALALRLFRGFDLAIGLHNNTGLSGQITLQLDPATGTWTQRELDFTFTGVMAPTVGVQLSRARWHFGAVYRAPLKLRFATPALISVADLDVALDLGISGTAHLLPASLGAGLEWRSKRLRIEAAAQWKDWSSMPDPALDARLDIRGADADQLGLGGVLDAPDAELQPRQAPNFADVISAGVGVSAFFGALTAHAGYSFIPSPVPDQIHQTNLIDGDRHLFGAAAQWRVKDPFELFARPLTFGLSGQFNRLAARRVDKALGAADPVGSWTASGQVLSISLGLKGEI
jgi:hypothetical protein